MLGPYGSRGSGSPDYAEPESFSEVDLAVSEGGSRNVRSPGADINIRGIRDLNLESDDTNSVRGPAYAKARQITRNQGSVPSESWFDNQHCTDTDLVDAINECSSFIVRTLGSLPAPRTEVQEWRLSMAQKLYQKTRGKRGSPWSVARWKLIKWCHAAMVGADATGSMYVWGDEVQDDYGPEDHRSNWFPKDLVDE